MTDDASLRAALQAHVADEAPSIATSPSGPQDSTPWMTPTRRPHRSDQLDALPDRPSGPDRPRDSGYPVV